MEKIGLDDARAASVVKPPRTRPRPRSTIGLPAIIRPSFTLGGTGGGIAYNRDEYDGIVAAGIEASPVAQGAGRAVRPRLEGIRDGGGPRLRKDNCIIICSIENLDPMGIHTGDSITVAPALTLTDKEYQIMRNASIAVPARDRRRHRRVQRPVRGRSRRRASWW